MQIRKWTFGIAVFLLSVLSTHAIDFVQTNRFILPESGTLAEETWVSAQEINIGGASSNDLFATAPDVLLNGTFGGDLWCAGNNISGTGVFHNSARMLSRTVQIQGTHFDTVTAIGTTVKIDRSAVLHSDLLCLGEHVIVEGKVEGETQVLATRVTLGGQFSRDVSLTGQEIVLLPGSVINGDLIYRAPDELIIPSSVTLNGALERRAGPVEPNRLFKQNPGTHYLFALAAWVTGLVFCGLFPAYMGTAQRLLGTSRGTCALAGFAGLVVLPMGAFFLALTLLGLPLSLLILLFYLILLYLSKIAVALWIGSALLRRREFNKQKAAAPLALGLLILYTLTGIIAAELIVNILVFIFGLGALLIALFKKPVLVIQTPDALNEINRED